MSTLVLTLDDGLARSLAVLAARSCKPLPEWAAEQLTRLAASTEMHAGTSYSAEWRAAFGSISDSSFDSPPRSLSRPVEALDAE